MRDDPDVCDVKPQKPSVVKFESETLKSTKWKPVLLPLNPNFLRLNSDRGSDEYCDEFAVMLQNEEFLAELRFVLNYAISYGFIYLLIIRFNQEFLSTLDKEQGRDERNFEERLKHMGKISRKKFHQLAKIFTFQRKKPSSQKPKNSKLLEQESEDESKN